MYDRTTSQQTLLSTLTFSSLVFRLLERLALITSRLAKHSGKQAYFFLLSATVYLARLPVMQPRLQPRGKPSVATIVSQAEPVPFAFPLSPLSDAAWFHHNDISSTWPVSPLMDPNNFLSLVDCFPLSPSSVAASDSSAAAAESNSPSPSSTAPSLPLQSPIPSSVLEAAPDALAAQPEFASAATTVEHLRQHRSAEALRRSREKAIVRRLHDLSGTTAGEDEQLSTATPSLAKRCRQKRKRAKLSVLEACAARIERLEELLNASELANRMSEAQLRQMSENIDGLVRRERQSMQWMTNSISLRGSGPLDHRFAYTLMDCRTGRLIDANSVFFTISGYTPSNILQRVLDPVLASPTTTATPVHDLPLVRAKRNSSDGSTPAEQWVPLRPLRQYPGTVQLLQELLTGRRDSYRAPFRSRWLDGNAYETYPTVWLVDVEWVEQADGSKRKRPLTFMCAAPVDDYCKIDED